MSLYVWLIYAVTLSCGTPDVKVSDFRGTILVLKPHFSFFKNGHSKYSVTHQVMVQTFFSMLINQYSDNHFGRRTFGRVHNIITNFTYCNIYNFLHKKWGFENNFVKFVELAWNTNQTAFS